MQPRDTQPAARNRKAGGRGVRISGYLPEEIDKALRDEVIRQPSRDSAPSASMTCCARSSPTGKTAGRQPHENRQLHWREGRRRENTNAHATAHGLSMLGTPPAYVMTDRRELLSDENRVYAIMDGRTVPKLEGA